MINKELAINIVLIIASIIDIRKQIVPSIIQLVLFFIIIINTQFHDYILPIIVFIVYLMLMQYLPPIGGADIKILTMLMINYKIYILIIIIISCLLGFSWIILSKKQIIPFVPCICGGVIICQILKNCQLI